MTKVNDSGRFIFNKKTEPGYDEKNFVNNPSKPENMANENIRNDTFAPKSLYTYSMGFSEIQANNNTYQDTNVYVSKPIKINENVLEVSLNALEEHPTFDEVSGKASSKQTSVEYYIAMNDKPSVNDWLPILPENKNKVKSERLMFNGINAKTLFPFKMHTVVIYKDGVKMKKESYYILNNQEVQIVDYNNNQIYTIDYKPNSFTKNPYVIEINDFRYNIEKITEEFPEGTDSNKTISLRHVPYIDKERIVNLKNFDPNDNMYKPIDVSIVNASIRNGDGISKNYVSSDNKNDRNPYTCNKTLYLDNSWSDMKRYNLEEEYYGLDYYQYKNKLTFADHINVPMIEENEQETPGTGTIRVSYDALVTNFRLKIILRRNSQREITATPRVKEYELKFKSTR